MSQPFQIAIDGPVAAGKGTISRLVAQRLDFLYVDTGAMYRVTAYLAVQNNTAFTDEDKLVELIKKCKLEMRNPTEDERDGRLTTVILDGEDVSWKIRTEEVSAGSSKVATLAQVRSVLVHKQQEIAAKTDVVMEGRDITYRVLPNAQLKIYLTAGDVVRAKRRHVQLQTRGEDITFQEVYRELLLRDQQDTERATDPLKIVPEAWEIDSSDLAIEQVIDMIVERAQIMRQL